VACVVSGIALWLEEGGRRLVLGTASERAALLQVTEGDKLWVPL